MTVPKSHCCRGHDMSIYRRKRGGSGSAYCFKCNQDRMNERNAQRSLDRQREKRRIKAQEGAFDILESVSPVYLRERVRAQAQSIKELQERIEALTLERDELAEQLRQPQRPSRIRSYRSNAPSTKRNRPGVRMDVGMLLARIS